MRKHKNTLNKFLDDSEKLLFDFSLSSEKNNEEILYIYEKEVLKGKKVFSTTRKFFSNEEVNQENLEKYLLLLLQNYSTSSVSSKYRLFIAAYSYARKKNYIYNVPNLQISQKLRNLLYLPQSIKLDAERLKIITDFYIWAQHTGFC